MKVNFGGMIPVSTIDWYGRSVSVIFFNGCPLRCPYCQNYRLINEINPIDIKEIEKKIIESKAFISAVVFSGGEPTMQYEALEHLAEFTKNNGLSVGIETNGYYPDQLEQLIRKKLVDKIFLDIKAPPLDEEQYREVTGGFGDAGKRALESLALPCVQLEVRTTVFRSFTGVHEIAGSLKGFECSYVIQQGIPENALDEKIRDDKILKREDMLALAMPITFLKDVRIRTRENGEEKVYL